MTTKFHVPVIQLSPGRMGVYEGCPPKVAEDIEAYNAAVLQLEEDYTKLKADHAAAREAIRTGDSSDLSVLVSAPGQWREILQRALKLYPEKARVRLEIGEAFQKIAAKARKDREARCCDIRKAVASLGWSDKHIQYACNRFDQTAIRLNVRILTADMRAGYAKQPLDSGERHRETEVREQIAAML